MCSVQSGGRWARGGFSQFVHTSDHVHRLINCRALDNYKGQHSVCCSKSLSASPLFNTDRLHGKRMNCSLLSGPGSFISSNPQRSKIQTLTDFSPSGPRLLRTHDFCLSYSLLLHYALCLNLLNNTSQKHFT